MNFNAQRKKQLGIRSLGDEIRSGKVKTELDPEKFVKGPKLFDCLHDPWYRGELQGVIADSGVGKTEYVLSCFKEILINNPNSVAIFVSLEMKTNKIAKRWAQMTEKNPELSDRLYVISRYREDGTSEDVNVKWVKAQLSKYKAALGDVATFAIDHLHVLGENSVSELNSIMTNVKEMCVELDAYGFILAQVSKQMAQKGEVPLDCDAVYGCSQFKWIATEVIQLHRPIKRYESSANISVLGYGYAKIREPHKDDTMRVGQNELLKYDLELRDFTKMNTADYTVFKQYYNDILVARGMEEKHKAHEYHMKKEVQGTNGKVVVIDEIFSGDVLEDL